MRWQQNWPKRKWPAEANCVCVCLAGPLATQLPRHSCEQPTQTASYLAGRALETSWRHLAPPLGGSNLKSCRPTHNSLTTRSLVATSWTGGNFSPPLVGGSFYFYFISLSGFSEELRGPRSGRESTGLYHSHWPACCLPQGCLGGAIRAKGQPKITTSLTCFDAASVLA